MLKTVMSVFLMMSLLVFAGCKGGGGGGSSAPAASVVVPDNNGFVSENNYTLDNLVETEEPSEQPQEEVVIVRNVTNPSGSENVNPEPSTLILFGISIFGLLGRKIRRKK